MINKLFADLAEKEIGGVNMQSVMQLVGELPEMVKHLDFKELERLHKFLTELKTKSNGENRNKEI